ncbi:hypothetical protein [Sphingomonas sp.]|jgi:hypothetical protein|uniref:hypothetical protein n=1 Tax=Sphingomonas sp. TaxID=28214 RepID=UPI002EDA9A12
MVDVVATADLAANSPTEGATLVGMDTGTLADHALASWTIQQFGTVTPGVDCSAVIADALTYIAAYGGGVLRFPKIGVPYETETRIVIDFSNIVVVLEEGITYTGGETGTTNQDCDPYGGVSCSQARRPMTAAAISRALPRSKTSR